VVTFALVAVVRQLRRAAAVELDITGAIVAWGIAAAGLCGCLAHHATGADPRPLLAAVSVLLLVAIVLAIARWAVLLPCALAYAAAFASLWHASYFEVPDAVTVLPVYGLWYAVFLVLPFALWRAVARWRAEVAPYLAAGLAGPLLFWPIHAAVRASIGSTVIGALPVALACVSVGGFVLVQRLFVASADSAAARARLRNLALFAAVAVGFIGVAIPLQLERQWITVGWAIEAAAVLGVFGRLPHPGLKYLAAFLYALVAVRLLLNPYVLSYEGGLPVLNWILYTYGVAAVACFGGARFLGPVERARLEPWEQAFYPRRGDGLRAHQSRGHRLLLLQPLH
jgi:hypothetical protein